MVPEQVKENVFCQECGKDIVITEDSGEIPALCEKCAEQEKDGPCEAFTSYDVRIATMALNVREKPGIEDDIPIVCCLVNDRGIHTIVEESEAPDKSKWGKILLASGGYGWISLVYTARV